MALPSERRRYETKEQKSARSKTYRSANPEAVALQKSVWYYNNRAKIAEKARAEYAANPEKHRLERIQRLYGLSALQFQSLWATQAGLCGICSEALQPGKHCHIDHDHATGAVRGLLCQHCNVGLGRFRDSIPRLQGAIVYLKKGE